MIFFDNVSLEEIASVKVKDIIVGPIQYDPVSRPRAISAGAELIRNRAASRTVTVTFSIQDDNLFSRDFSLMRVSGWAKTDREYRLDLPGYPDHYLMAMCTEKPRPSSLEWWESELRLIFTCFENPYWNSRIEKSAACGTDFFVAGDAPPLMRIERTVSGLAVLDQSYGLDGRTINFTSIPVGNMVIDLNAQTAQVGNNSIMQYYNVNSKFLIPRAGNQKITGTGTIKFRERWQ